MKVLVIEEEPKAVRRLTSMLVELEKEIHIACVLNDLVSGSDYLKAAPDIDLIFADIQMDGAVLDSFKLACTETPVIFITNRDEYALQAFRFNSIDYLLKPLQKQALEAAIRKFKKWHIQCRPYLQEDLTDVLRAVSPRLVCRDRFLARNGTRLVSIPAGRIAYFYTRDKQQYIKTIQNEDLPIDKRLEDIEAEIDTTCFFRVNRQFILNYSNIEKVQAWFSGKLKVQVNPAAYEEIVVSRLKANRFKKWLGE